RHTCSLYCHRATHNFSPPPDAGVLFRPQVLTKARIAMSIAVWRDFCAVAPSPELRARQRDELSQFRDARDSPLLRRLAPPGRPRWPGFDDGTIIPPAEFPLGT